MHQREFADADALLSALRADLVAMLAPVTAPLAIDSTQRPFVILIVGVNGVGKTTTIGKLARASRRRAAACCSRPATRSAPPPSSNSRPGANATTCRSIAQGSGADSASVIFDALQSARSRGTSTC